MHGAILTLCLLVQPAIKPIPASDTVSSTTGGVKAEIQDEKHAPVPAVEIRLKHRDGRTWVASTDDRGRFRAGGLPPGDYEMSLHHAGFQTEWYAIKVLSNSWLRGLEETAPKPRAKGGRRLILVGPPAYEGFLRGVKPASKAEVEKIPMH